MREVNEGSTTMLRVLNAVILCANSLVAWKKKESDPVSSPLNAKAGTFSYAGYLYSVCRQLHYQSGRQLLFPVWTNSNMSHRYTGKVGCEHLHFCPVLSYVTALRCCFMFPTFSLSFLGSSPCWPILLPCPSLSFSKVLTWFCGPACSRHLANLKFSSLPSGITFDAQHTPVLCLISLSSPLIFICALPPCYSPVLYPLVFIHCSLLSWASPSILVFLCSQTLPPWLLISVSLPEQAHVSQCRDTSKIWRPFFPLLSLTSSSPQLLPLLVSLSSHLLPASVSSPLSSTSISMSPLQLFLCFLPWLQLLPLAGPDPLSPPSLWLPVTHALCLVVPAPPSHAVSSS